MALTHERAKEIADEFQAVSTAIVELQVRSARALDKNADFSIDWAGQSKPVFLNEDAAGNIDGTKFTRQQLANAIGAVDQFRKYAENESVTQGDYIGVLNQLANVELP